MLPSPKVEDLASRRFGPLPFWIPPFLYRKKKGSNERTAHTCFRMLWAGWAVRGGEIRERKDGTSPFAKICRCSSREEQHSSSYVLAVRAKTWRVFLQGPKVHHIIATSFGFRRDTSYSYISYDIYRTPEFGIWGKHRVQNKPLLSSRFHVFDSRKPSG